VVLNKGPEGLEGCQSEGPGLAIRCAGMGMGGGAGLEKLGIFIKRPSRSLCRINVARFIDTVGIYFCCYRYGGGC
jgi:hypothetical protein